MTLTTRESLPPLPPEDHRAGGRSHPRVDRSDSITHLAAALAKAQAAIAPAALTGENPHFRSRYADLASVWDAIREPLTSNGIAVLQLPATVDHRGETVVVTTILAHRSGEWISSELAMRPVKSDPQGIGSCLTYARRYALAAIAGVAPDDDDGNAASDRPVTREGLQREAATPPARRPPLTSTRADADTRPISAAQVKRLFAIAKAAGRDSDDVRDYIRTVHGFESSSDVTRDRYDDIVEWLRDEEGKLSAEPI